MAGAIVAAVSLARTPHGWLASSVAVVLALPRSFLYDVTWVMVGAPDEPASGTKEPYTAPQDAP